METIAAIRIEIMKTSFIVIMLALDILFAAITFAGATRLVITRKSKMRPAVLGIVVWQTGLCVLSNIASLVLYSIGKKTDAMLMVLDWLDFGSTMVTCFAVLVFYRATNRCLERWISKTSVPVRMLAIAGATVVVLAVAFPMSFLVGLALGMKNRGAGLALFMFTALFTVSPMLLSTFYLIQLARQYRATHRLPNLFLNEPPLDAGSTSPSCGKNALIFPPSPTSNKPFNPRWTLKWLGIFQTFLFVCYSPFLFVIPAIFIYDSKPGMLIVGLDFIFRSAINVFLASMYAFRPSVRMSPPATPEPEASQAAKSLD